MYLAGVCEFTRGGTCMAALLNFHKISKKVPYCKSCHILTSFAIHTLHLLQTYTLIAQVL